MDVEERETFHLLSAVNDGHLDVAFARTDAAQFKALASHVLHEEPFVAAIPADHALAQDAAPLALAAVMWERLVLYRRKDGVGIFDVLMAALRSVGHAPDVAEEVPRIIAAINLVAAELGVSLVPASMRMLHNERVVYQDLVAGSLPLMLIHRRDNNTALVRNFIAVARAAARGEGSLQ